MRGKLKFADLLFGVIIIAIILVMLIPLPTTVMDVLLIINITIGLLIMVMSMYIKEPVDFSVFPTLLLIITFFKLILSLSTTRLILSNGGDAGNVIKVFGSVVIGNNIVVGAIIFLIIMVIQFMVITKGAERVAEVSARFTLDAMPGKQMAIDADLNSGLIDEAVARQRRETIQREADFHGAMDGASKFIKNDAIIAIIVTIINIIGGLIIGFMTSDMEIMEIIQLYTMATIGDGLVNAIPSLLISTASGIIVTRSGTKQGFGQEVIGQIGGQPGVLMITGILLLPISFVPGLPKIPMWIISAILIGFGYYLMTREKEVIPEETPDTAAIEAAAEKRKPESVTSLLQVSPIEFEFGYGLVPMVEVSQGGDLLDRVVMIRRQCALDLGVIVPSIRLRDNIQLGTNVYVIKIKGVEVASGEVMAEHLLALSTGEVEEEIYGIPTIEPAFGLPALWISKADREKAELLGYSTVDPPSVIATHLTEIIKRYGHELLSRQQVQTLIENLAQAQPALVEEVVPKMFSLGEIQKVLSNLLKENVPIRDMGTIVETLGDYGNLTRDTEMLTEYVRQNLRRSITRRFVPDNLAHVITLDPQLEQLIVEHTKQSEHGAYLALEPTQIHTMFDRLRSIIERLRNVGKNPVVLTSPLVRRQFRKIAEQVSPDIVVLSYNELEQNVEVMSEGIVRL